MTETMTTAPETGQPADGGNGAQTQGFDFNSALSVEYRDNPSITKFGGDINKLSKSYLELQSLMGQGRVTIPKDENDVTAWGMYDKSFGVPETADKYELNAPDGVDLTEFKTLMKQNHIPPKVAQTLLDAHIADFAAFAEAEAQQAEADKAAAEETLKKEWGLKYKENMAAANNFLQKLSDTKEDYDYFVGKIGNDAKFIKLLAKMGASVSEGSLGGMEGQVLGFTKTPSEAKAEFERIMNDANDAYFAGVRNKRNDPSWCRANNQTFVTEQERKERVAYVQSLMQMMG